jgi:hypothetical protein
MRHKNTLPVMMAWLLIAAWGFWISSSFISTFSLLSAGATWLIDGE